MSWIHGLVDGWLLRHHPSYCNPRRCDMGFSLSIAPESDPRRIRQEKCFVLNAKYFCKLLQAAEVAHEALHLRFR
jgi:hypothetical protein